MTDEVTLESIGVSPQQEQLYRALLRLPHADVEELAARTGLAPACVEALLRELHDMGLVSEGPDGDRLPLPPRMAIEPLISEQIRGLEKTRLMLGELTADYETYVADPLDGHPLVDVLYDTAQVRMRFEHLQRTAEVQIRAFDTPPYVMPPSVNPEELEALRRGVAYRIVYARGALEMPGAMEWLTTHTRAGEQARVIEELPLKVCIVDDRVALLAYRTPIRGKHTSLLVHPSPLLTSLIELFELNWRVATPVRLDAGDPELSSIGVSAQDLRLVTMLAAGMKDPTIGRHLGMSQRTVQRRVHDLSQAFGARNRLELLLHFARRGLLPDKVEQAAPRAEVKSG